MGHKCEEVCPEGFYGQNCIAVCNCNRKPNFLCHPSHGCVCKSGFKGENCDISLVGELTGQEEGELEFVSILALIPTNTKLYGKEYENDNFTTISNQDVRDLMPKSPINETTYGNRTDFSKTATSPMEEVFTFHPLAGITFETKIGETLRTTSEEVFSFHPLLTTPEMSVSNVTETTTTKIPTSSIPKEQTSMSQTTTETAFTDFFSENPKNVLITSTERLPTSVTQPEPLLTPEVPIDSNETKGDEDISNVNDDLALSHPNSSKSSESPENESGQSFDKNENNLPLDLPHNETSSDEDDKISSTASVFISILITSTQSNTVSVFGEKFAYTTSTGTFSSINQSYTGPFGEDSLVASTNQTFVNENSNRTKSSNPGNSPNATSSNSNSDESSDESKADKQLPSNSSSVISTSTSSDDSEEIDNSLEIGFFFNHNKTGNSTKRRPRLRNFFYYYFITAIRANETRAKEQNQTAEKEKQEHFLGMPGDPSCVEHQTSALFSSVDTGRDAILHNHLITNFSTEMQEFFICFANITLTGENFP